MREVSSIVGSVTGKACFKIREVSSIVGSVTGKAFEIREVTQHRRY